MISNSKNKDCNFILKTSEYKIIKDKFLEFFNNDIVIKKEFTTLNSKCYHIDKYIVKFGMFHIPDEVAELPQLVKIYYRNNIEINYDNSVIFLGIEIQDFIEEDDTCSYNEMYELYKSLRKMGYIWIDANFSNVKKKNGKVLIIDSDFIYKENEADYFNQSTLSKELEEKYLKEIEV